MEEQYDLFTIILAKSVSGPLSESDCPNSVRPARESVCTRHDTTRSLISINKYPLCLGQNREQLSTAGSLNSYAVFHIRVRSKREPISSLIWFLSMHSPGRDWIELIGKQCTIELALDMIYDFQTLEYYPAIFILKFIFLCICRKF